MGNGWVPTGGNVLKKHEIGHRETMMQHTETLGVGGAALAFLGDSLFVSVERTVFRQLEISFVAAYRDSSSYTVGRHLGTTAFGGRCPPRRLCRQIFVESVSVFMFAIIGAMCDWLQEQKSFSMPWSRLLELLLWRYNYQA